MRRSCISIQVAVVLLLVSSTLSQTPIDLFVDPGHGGPDEGNPGAYIPDFSEDTVNLLVALILKDYLDLPPAYTYQFSRLNNVDTVSLQERAEDAMNSQARAFISIHHNADPDPYKQYTVAFYCSTSYIPGSSPPIARNTDHKLAYKCALNIHELFKYDLGWGPPAGLGQQAFVVLKNDSMPSALIEASFLSDSAEERKFYYNTLFHREQEASAIYDAHDSWRKGQGFGKVDYAYSGQAPPDSHKVRIQDYLTVEFNTNDPFTPLISACGI